MLAIQAFLFFGPFTCFPSHALLSGIALRRDGQSVNTTNIFTELERRNVYRAAVASGVVASFFTQLTTQVFPFFQIPNPAVRFLWSLRSRPDFQSQCYSPGSTNLPPKESYGQKISVRHMP
jgi:hypothetical protein